jgi:hypothetical protein
MEPQATVLKNKFGQVTGYKGAQADTYAPPAQDMGFDHQAFNAWLAKKYPQYSGVARPPDFAQRLPQLRAEFLGSVQPKPTVPTVSNLPAPAATPPPAAVNQELLAELLRNFQF